ncbi:MAG TPA: BON domain-containing protein [Burkholderiales bacterium]|nr:BON domain-containing protein [Burkholderiales bacterium]
MKCGHDFKKRVGMVLITSAAILAGGCDKQNPPAPSGETVGQKVDKMIDKTNDAAEKAGSKIGEAAKATEEAAKSAAETVQQKAGQVGTVIEDSTITASIKANLIKDTGLSVLKIDVDTVKGEVTLKGEVESNVARERAERIAAAVTGVTKVNNSLIVKEINKKVSWKIVLV